MTLYSILLTLHIITFSLSLLLFPALALIALATFRFYRIIDLASIVSTSIGFTTGVVLLVIHPAGTQCLELTVYLIAFSTLYWAARRATFSRPVHDQI